MNFKGKAISVDVNDNIATLTFDLQGESVNKFNRLTLGELKEVGQLLTQAKDIKGLLVRSNKDSFIVGADITEFGDMFHLPEEEMLAGINAINADFSVFEDLPFPTVTAINGLALGGGLEMALTTDFRVMDSHAKIGFPEVKLGIIPGYGGTVRAPRIIGTDNAVEWIATGKDNKAKAALAAGMVDAVVEADQLDAAAMDLLQKAINGDFDIAAIRKQKTSPLQLDDIENIMAFTTAKALIGQQAGRHYKAPMYAVKTIEKAAKLGRDEAIKVENEAVTKLGKMEITGNMINLFLGDQALTKTAKGYASNNTPVERAAVLGAGIMGGGIAYQSASTGTPIIMKDIAQAGIDMGMGEAAKLLSTKVKRGRLTADKMAATLNKITPTLSYDGIDQADLIVEAVVENPAVKKAVLAEVEGLISDDTILTSNTSTIPITELASALKRPENFCGMHFFNPVHKMPLVEIIRGEKTSDAAIARTVNYALAMKKKPVVVNDCPGFLVNRILFAYFAGFVALVKEGADFVAIDKAAEKFGWPMGPAYLCDVVGIDTGVHAGKVMSDGFPDRMGQTFKTCLEVMLENDRLGEKNSQGFYDYKADKRGKLRKTYNESVKALLAPHVDAPKEFSEEEIMDRLMVPFCLESIRCLEADIVSSATDLDMALIFGVGFPPFKGGAIRFVENMGLAAFVEKADQYKELGPLYHPTDTLRDLAANNGSMFK
ncbi:fatty acid oxidation complex subunit alpha FadB [Oceanicoccus sagamiensis]|uniref:enoyl-CoA hydratase n=1 Tax=Oceanicoccus sagamiensis TaxID=716816 RepID=A0A1X9NDB1_9GAMM|nr:fatty acid oxidation complex subunit alpha FadB [Oceanicoccus sagamiensis]ARN76020.1 multifunctional fatty acid oxidation complex subunit alpha [Oceanicoccus sagamiensis]